MKVAVILANGFEEIEAITSIDVLRRAGIEVVAAGLDGLEIQGANGVKLLADTTLDKLNLAELEMIVLPGGLPGANYLAASKELLAALKSLNEAGKKLAAICAAPLALEAAGVLGQKWTSYPGFESRIRQGAKGYLGTNVAKDKNIITGKGPALSMEFALELVKELKGDSVYNEVKAGLLF